MIEAAIKKALERITGMKVYPLLLPADQLEGVTYQRISDPEISTGMVRTGLVEGRFQITLYAVNDYTKLVQLDSAIWNEWKQIQHGMIEDYPVQYVQRSGIQEGKETLTNGSTLYDRKRDFILTFKE